MTRQSEKITTKKQWKKIIESQIKYDHDYIPSFQTTIDILSEILAERDRVYQFYIKSGGQPVVNFTSDRGAVNLKQNPLLKQWTDLNTSALNYLDKLGLTAAGLRKLQGQLPKDEIKRPDFELLDSKPWYEGMTDEERSCFDENGILIDMKKYTQLTEGKK